MDYLRPAGDAPHGALEWLQYLQRTKKKDTGPSARDNNKSFDRTFHGFLQLPPEIRIEIYKLAFIDPRGPYEGSRIGRPCGRMPPKSRLRSGKSIRPFSEDVRENQKALEGMPILAVAFTCRQVYLEAAPIYYGGIIWRFRSRQWLELFLETLGRKNKVQGIGMGILEAIRHIRIKLLSSRMMALAAQFPRLHRLDIFNEHHHHKQTLHRVLNKTFPTVCPQQMPFLKTLNYGAKCDANFLRVIWTRDDQGFGLRMAPEWYQLHTVRQLRLFGDAIGQQTRDSIKAVHMQFDRTAMAEEVLRSRNLVTIRLSYDHGALQLSSVHTLRDKLKSLRAGLPSFGDVEVLDPRDSAKFLLFEDFSSAEMDRTIWDQAETCDTSSEESSREPTPAAWASS